MRRAHPALLLARLVAAAILVPVASMKLLGRPADVALFAHLGMEPTGRLLIGAIELLAGFLLLTPYAASGALLAVGVMLGAIIAHATFLGFDLRHGWMLLAVFGCSLGVLIARRGDLPLIGRTLTDRTSLP